MNSAQQWQRHRHQRQISTPTAFEAAKASNMPVSAQQFHAHRRGQSLDQCMAHTQRPMPIQDGPFLTTNATAQQSQYLRQEAQRQAFSQQANASFAQNSNGLPAFSSESLTQNDLQLLASLNSGDVTYIGPNIILLGTKGWPSFNGIQQRQLQLLNQNHEKAPRQVFHNQPIDAHQENNFAAFPPQPNGFSGGRLRRQSVQSDASAQSQPPQTPSGQRFSEYYPLTPAKTPFDKSTNNPMYHEAQSTPSRAQGSSMPGMTDAAYMQRARSLQGVVGTTFTQRKFELPTPPDTASFEHPSKNVFGVKQGSSFEHSKSQPISPQHYTSSAMASSFYSAPELADLPSSGDGNGKNPKIPIYPVAQSKTSPRKAANATPSTSPTKTKLSPRTASIDNLNLDSRVHASITETGVTSDEIASYIQGPDPGDGMWSCLHPGCDRRFGRKENIKSHVQTHLGDRQYKCEDCGKCFVRGHDLKRHAKIHTGDKPYVCECGNVFARQDALTRHKQRGMCIGGYQGVVRKAVKRGRPKKHRPDMEERQEKAVKTRQRVSEKSATQAITMSNSSPNSPAAEYFEAMTRGQNGAIAFTTPNYSLPPDVLTFTPPASPGHIASKSSTSQANRSITPSTEDEMLPMPSSLLSSPHTAPTLTDSSAGSDLDIFINQDDPGSLDSGMGPFPSYASFDAGIDFYQDRPVVTDEMLGYPSDAELPSGVMGEDLFLE